MDGERCVCKNKGFRLAEAVVGGCDVWWLCREEISVYAIESGVNLRRLVEAAAEACGGRGGVCWVESGG